MNHIKILSCGLLVGLGLSIAAPQCQAQYTPSYEVDEGSTTVVQSDTFNEGGYSQYSAGGGILATSDGTLQGDRQLTARGPLKAPNGGANANPSLLYPVYASVSTVWYWNGNGTPPPFTFRFFPSYDASASGNGTYDGGGSVSASLGATRRPPSAGSPQDDWDIYGGTANIQAPFGGTNPVFAEDRLFLDAMRSYPCADSQPSFQVDVSATLTGSGVSASGKGSEVNLSETVILYKEITIDTD